MSATSAVSSTELLGRARAGDAAALDSLVALYLPRMRRWARGRMPSGARPRLDTEDIVQDTMLAALRNLSHVEVRGEGALQAYLRRALTNRLTDLYRRQVARPAETMVGSDIADQAPSPLEAAIGAEALERYERALSRLSATDREAVILRFELRCGYEEIAGALHKATAAHARVIVSRAAARLAREMRHGRA
jgi:RNA polymerase sigma-70 factor (ECF subfamily)